jgi:hypothetical protein
MEKKVLSESYKIHYDQELIKSRFPNLSPPELIGRDEFFKRIEQDEVKIHVEQILNLFSRIPGIKFEYVTCSPLTAECFETESVIDEDDYMFIEYSLTAKEDVVPDYPYGVVIFHHNQFLLCFESKLEIDFSYFEKKWLLMNIMVTDDEEMRTLMVNLVDMKVYEYTEHFDLNSGIAYWEDDQIVCWAQRGDDRGQVILIKLGDKPTREVLIDTSDLRNALIGVNIDKGIMYLVFECKEGALLEKYDLHNRKSIHYKQFEEGYADITQHGELIYCLDSIGTSLTVFDLDFNVVRKIDECPLGDIEINQESLLMNNFALIETTWSETVGEDPLELKHMLLLENGVPVHTLKLETHDLSLAMSISTQSVIVWGQVIARCRFEKKGFHNPRIPYSQCDMTFKFQ